MNTQKWLGEFQEWTSIFEGPRNASGVPQGTADERVGAHQRVVAAKRHLDSYTGQLKPAKQP